QTLKFVFPLFSTLFSLTPLFSHLVFPLPARRLPSAISRDHLARSSNAVIGLFKICSPRYVMRTGWKVNLPGSYQKEVLTMALFTWLQRLSRGIVTHNKSGGTRLGRSRSSGYRPRLEELEARLAPATNITILASGVGSLDHLLSATNGTITTAADPG